MNSADKSQHRRQRHQASAFDMSSIWFAFRRKWLLILFFGISLGVGVGFAVWRYLPQPKASAQAIYEVGLVSPVVVSRLPDEREFNSFKQYQSNLVTKRSVLASILNEPGIMSIKDCAQAKDPFRWLEDTLKVDFKMGKEYLRITVELDSPQDALMLIKAADMHYMFEAVNKEKQSKQLKYTNMAALKEQKKKSLEDEYAKLKELGVNGGAPSDQVAALAQEYIQKSLTQQTQERLQWESKIRELEVELAGRTATAAKISKVDPPEYMVQAELDANSQLKAEKAVLVELERGKKVLEDALAPGASVPKLGEYGKEIAAQKKLVDELPKRLRAAAVDAARTKHFIATNAEKESLEQRLATAKNLKDQLKKETDKLAANIKNLNSTQQDFAKTKGDIDQLKKTADTLSATVEAMDIELDAPDRVKRFQEPMVSIADDVQRRIKFSLMGLLGGFVLGAAPVWLRELRRKIFHEESQLTEGVSVPLIGTIPHIPRRRRAHARNAVVAQPRMRALVTESIDSARATVLFKLQETGGRAVMVTSSVAGEAKSSVSGHIAISLARAGFRTLIIDSDMRRPTLHRVFGVQKGPGFSDVLLGKKTLDETMQSCQLQNLHVLSAGDWIPAASASLAGGAWTELLKDAKELFDVVIVDSPPVLLVADALTMARDVDAVLLSALKDVSEIDLLNRSIVKLESLGISPMGMIASGITHRMYTSRYYDRYAAAYTQRVRS